MKLNKNTKKARRMIGRFIDATCRSVTEFYKKPSINKILAEMKIIDEMTNNDGFNFYITGGNASTFSCAYQCITADNEWYIIYHTANNTYLIEL